MRSVKSLLDKKDAESRIIGLHYDKHNHLFVLCGGPDSNRRTPMGVDLESTTFGLTR